MDFKRGKWPWDVHEPRVKHQGYLLKSGRYFGERTAKKRHVALVVDLGGAYLLIGGEGDEEIGSLSQMQDAVGTRKCVDLLVGCTIEERGDDRLGFAVRSPGRTYVFVAMGLEQKLRWVTRLKNAVATGIEQSARPDVLEDAQKNLEQQRGRNSGHHRATTGPARWQESAGTTDDYVELAESLPPKPRAEDEEKMPPQPRERGSRFEGGGGHDAEEQKAQRRHRRRRGTGAGDSAAAPSTSEEQHAATRTNWRDTMREYSDAMNSSPDASREFDKELDSDALSDEMEDNPLARGPASVSWASPPPPSTASHHHHLDMVRGFSPVGPVGRTSGVDPASTTMPASPSPAGRTNGKAAGGPVNRGSWDEVDQRRSAPAGRGGDGGGTRRDHGGGKSLRDRTAMAKVAVDRSRRSRTVVDRELAPGEIMRDDESDEDEAALPGASCPAGARGSPSSP